MEKGKRVALEVVAPGAAAAEEEEGRQEPGGSSGSSSSSSWKAGLGALVAGTATAATASAVVHFLVPTPLASRPARCLPSYQSSAALKSSWIKRLRGLQGDGELSGKECKQIVQSAPVDGEGSRAQQQRQQQRQEQRQEQQQRQEERQQQRRREQQQQYQRQLQGEEQEQERKAAGDDGTVTARMDSDTSRVRVFRSGILAPGSRSGEGPDPIQPEQQPGVVVGSRRRGGGDSAQQQAVRGGETMILSRRVKPPDVPRPPAPAADSTADHSGTGKDVRRMDSEDAESEMARFMNGVRTTAQKVTFAPSTKDSTDRRMEPRKRPPQDLEHEGRHPFRFSQMDTVLEDAAAAPEQAAGGSSGFGIFRLNAAALAPKPMGPPSKKPAIASSRNGKMSMGSFAFSTPDRNSVPQPPPPPSAPVAPVPVPAAQPSLAPGPGPGPGPGPAAAGSGPFVPPTSAELAVWKARPEKKPSFQLLKSDITKEEETERLQRRNGQLLESMLANRQAEKGKELFGSARTGASQALPPRSYMRPDGSYTSGFLSYVKKLQSDGAGRTGEAAGKARAFTAYQPGTSFDGTGAEGSMARDSRQRGGKMRQVFQDTEPGDAKPSQRHADTLSRLWQGIAEQPSLLTPLFAPYKAVDEGLGNSILPSNDLRKEGPSPLTPLFSPFKYPQDDGSQARRLDRPPLPRRVDPPPSFPFTFSATGKRPAAPSPNIPAPSGSAAADPQDFGRNMSQGAPGLRGSRPTSSAEAPNKFESQSSHYSNSPWPPEEARFGVYEEAGSRANVQGFVAPSRPSASGAVRGFQPGLENDVASARSQGPSAFNKRKHRGLANREEGGPSGDPGATHAWVPQAIGQTLLQRYTAEPGDSSGSTPPLLPPKTGLGMKYAGFNNLVPMEPLIVPSQSLQAGGGESDSQIPSSPKVPKMMDMSPEMPRRDHPSGFREQGVAGGTSIFEGSPGRGSVGASERASRPVRRNVLNEVQAEGPSYISSRALHHSSSKARSFPGHPTMPDGDAEDSDQTVLPRLSGTWINRWLPANSALPSCQPSNSKSAARPPAQGPRTNMARTTWTAHQHTSGNVRLSSFDQPAGSRGQGRRQDRGHTGDHSAGFESGRDRWFHATSDGANPSGSGPSAAAMAIVGRAMRNLTSTSPMLWRQGASAVRPSSDSHQASASGHSEQQRSDFPSLRGFGRSSWSIFRLPVVDARFDDIIPKYGGFKPGTTGEEVVASLTACLGRWEELITDGISRAERVESSLRLLKL